MDAGGDAKKTLQSKFRGVWGEGDDRAGMTGGDDGGILDVIKMLVGEQEGIHYNILRCQPGSHALRCVDGDGAAFVSDEPAVGLGDSACKVG